MSVNSKSYKGLKIAKNRSHTVNDPLTAEEALQININGKAFTVTMRSPGYELDLARGLLYTEGIYTHKSPLKMKASEINDEGIITSVGIWISPENIGEQYFENRSLLSVSSCGICGKKELKDIELSGAVLKTDYQFDSDIIPALFEKMRKAQDIFEQTGGCHAAAAFDFNGDLMSLREDIGRHNAVDKVIGNLLNNSTLKLAKILLVSGRISYEIVSKCFKAKIPVLAAVSAPSTLAVECAKSMGITLLGFCRGEHFTCYANEHRILYGEKISISS